MSVLGDRQKVGGAIWRGVPLKVRDQAPQSFDSRDETTDVLLEVDSDGGADLYGGSAWRAVK
jgi:hypothetical protein